MVTIADIWQARPIVMEAAIRSPLIRLRYENQPGEIYLKLENLQPIGSFKLRGAWNAMRHLPRETVERGVITASAGNMAQGLAFAAQAFGVPCAIIAPDTAPAIKQHAVERMGGEFIKVPRERWWQTFLDRSFPGYEDRTFVHAFDDDLVIAGNGTIGIEILEDLPDVDTVVAPFGGGGLAVGVATALKALKPGTRIIAAEVETAAPLSASLEAGEASSVGVTPSFVDGIGTGSLLPRMYDYAKDLIDDTHLVALADAEAAIRLLAERQRIIAEGASACALATALAGVAGEGKTVVIVSGGNIDPDVLARILTGQPAH